ncbi:MAG: hypothetical protein CL868_04340 [Cytophagaceae bacterium]|nr:hypothetical protein [Cytophagaceae bacterium]|tara:strand:- start:3785 stop:6217 length:2433 start_codon:yes stop_codon:yes gene_type:complete
MNFTPLRTFLMMLGMTFLLCNFKTYGQGPDITGKYSIRYTSDKTTQFNITKTGNGVHLEPAMVDDTLPLAIKNLVGDYVWDSQTGAFAKWHSIPGSTLRVYLFKVNDKSLAMRRGDNPYLNLTKEEGSLMDVLTNKKADVSHLLGIWKIEGTTSSVSFTSAVDTDLNIRFGGQAYGFQKDAGGVFETYSGTGGNGEGITLKVMGPNSATLSISGVDTQLVRNGGTSASAKSSSASTGATGASTVMDDKMFKAIQQKDFMALEEVINMGANVNAANTTGKTALHEAITKRDVAMVETLLDNNADVNKTDLQGKTPLDLALINDSSDPAMAFSILNRRPSISQSSMQQAMQLNNNDLIDAMIDAGADKKYFAQQAIERRNTDLFYKLLDEKNLVITTQMFDAALRTRNFPLADRMIASRFNPNYAIDSSIKADQVDLVYAALEQGGNADAALNYAIKKKDAELAGLALNDHGANAPSALKAAIAANSVAISQLAIQAGANPSAELPAASLLGNVQTMDLLIKAGADPNPSLLVAAKANKPQAVALLLTSGANPDALLKYGIEMNATDYVRQAVEAGANIADAQFLAVSAGNGNLEIVKMLVAAGALPDDGLEAATKANKPDIAAYLVEMGADASSNDLLGIAARTNNTSFTSIYLNAGAEAQSAVSAAVQAGADKVLKQLITAGADASSAGLLLTAVMVNSAPVTAILIDQGVNTNIQNQANGYFLMHYAAQNDNAALIRLLAANGAPIDPTVNGNTPLHLAVDNRNAVNAVDALIKAGADVNATNGEGKSVLRIAKGNKTKKLLKEAGAEK